MAVAQPSHQAPSAPSHVAIIMDGNGRWAKRRMLPRAIGHRKGADAVRRAVRGALSEGVRYLTLYAFSSENWKRPADEVDDLMGLLRLYIRQEIDELDANGVRVRFIGGWRKLSPDIVSLIDGAVERTRHNDTLHLVIALNYGSQAEIVAASRRLAEDVAAGRLTADDITEDRFAGCLETVDVPDPDMVIRTSGEKRLSNFLLWQSAYAELVFLDLLWPDFTEETLATAIREFQGRERRFGARS